MTQKELLYLEDAIGHEKNIIKILNDSKEKVEDSMLITFLENEIKLHELRKENLLEKLKEESYEWSSDSW